MLALLTEEQEMLKEAAAQVAAVASPAQPSDIATVDRAKAWATLASSGFLSLRDRDGAGVPAASGVEVMLVALAFGESLSPVPYLGDIVAAELLWRSGSPASWCSSLSAGDERYGLLLTPDLGGLARVGAGSTDTGLGAGAGALAFDVDEATYALALSTDGEHVVRVSLDAGFEPADGADLTRCLLRLRDPFAVRAEVGGAAPAGPAADGWLALALVAASADVIGAMSSALYKAVEYAKERVQYGVKIGSFQAIQHLCADALVDVEGALSVARYAAWAVDALPAEEALLAARVAKAYSSGCARSVTETAMQVFGGIGQTWEHIAHVHTRRALTGRALFGDESAQLAHVADARLGPPPAE